MPDNPTGEKTEKPTPKRIKESREEGQVARSQELNQAFTLLGGFIALFFLFRNFIFSLQQYIVKFISMTTIPVFTAENVFNILWDNFLFMLYQVGPIMGVILFVGLIINFIQVGPLFTVKSIQPKLENIDPVKGLKRVFSLKALAELIKSLLKATIIVVIVYIYTQRYWPYIITMSEQGLRPALTFIGNLIFRIGMTIIIFLIILGVFDYLYQRWEHLKNLKMSKYEVKQERKEMEGDPLIRSKRREKQRQMSMNRMMTAMETADVVITNPTHVAVALKYDIEEMAAPLVVAKGEGFLALKIKEKANELKIEIVENRELARALFETTELDQQIPEDLYQAVAEVLAFVYSK